MLKSRKMVVMAGLMLLGFSMIALTGCEYRGASFVREVLANPGKYTAYSVIYSEPEFSTLKKALSSANLDDTFKMPGNYTIFAPTNAAFARMPAGNLTSLERDTNHQPLRNLLWYHISLVDITSAAAKLQPVQTMGDGQKALITSNGTKITGIDGAHVVGKPIYCRNAVIYPIDAVLAPKPIGTH